MKQFYAIAIAIVIATSSFAQQGKIFGQITYRPSDSTITLSYFLMNLTGSSSNCQLMGIRVGMHYNPAVVSLVSDSMMTYLTSFNTGLNATEFSPSFGADTVTISNTTCVNTTNNQSKTYIQRDYTRSTNSNGSIIALLPNQPRLVYRAMFKLNAGVSPEFYNLTGANGGFGANNFIAEFLNASNANTFGTNKEIAMIVDVQNGSSLYRPWAWSANGNNNPIQINAGDVTFNVAGSTLPVNFTSFTGNVLNGYNNLRWTIENEDADCMQYEVERKIGGDNFKTIAVVLPNGTNGAMAYLFKEKTFNGIAYYRIKQICKSGKVVYSSIVALGSNNNNAINVSVFPNPASEYFTIGNAPAGQNLIVTMYDLNGRIIKQNNYTQNSRISLQGVQPGFYMVSISNDKNDFQSSTKLMVK